MLCLFMAKISLVLTAPTHKAMARLSWPGWQFTYILSADGLPSKYLVDRYHYTKPPQSTDLTVISDGLVLGLAV